MTPILLHPHPGIHRFLSSLGWAWIAFVALPFYGRTATLEVEWNRNPVMLGEAAILNVVVVNGEPESSPHVNPVPGLTLGMGGQSTEFSILNGKSTRRQRFRFLVQANQPGDYQIPPVNVSVEGKILTQAVAPLKVLPQDAAAASGESAFIRLLAPQTNLVVGQAFQIEIQIYTEANRADELKPPEIATDGITFLQTPPHKQTRVRRGDKVYDVFAFPRLLAPTRPGPLQLGPVSTSLNQFQSSGQRDFFGRLIGSWVPRNLASEAVTLEVAPLPAAGKPEAFQGAIGAFTDLSVTASPLDLKAGDPVTLTMTLTGRGNWDRVEAPSLELSESFKPYPATTTKTDTDELGWSGSRTFEQVIIPEAPEIQALPKIRFHYFDPDTRAYKTLEKGPIPIRVRPSNQASAFAQVAEAEAGEPGSDEAPDKPSDILHIRPHLGLAAGPAIPWVLRPAFWCVQSLPMLALLGAAWFNRRQRRLENDPHRCRLRDEARSWKTRHPELRRLAMAGDATFYTELHLALQECVGAALNRPASGVSRDVVQDHLRPAGVPEGVTRDLDMLFERCDQARFMPGSEPGAREAELTQLENARQALLQCKLS